MNNERKTCPECNSVIINGRCSNMNYCSYKGQGWTKDQRIAAWARHGTEERTTGSYYDYTGRD